MIRSEVDDRFLCIYDTSEDDFCIFVYMTWVKVKEMLKMNFFPSHPS